MPEEIVTPTAVKVDSDRAECVGLTLPMFADFSLLGPHWVLRTGGQVLKSKCSFSVLMRRAAAARRHDTLHALFIPAHVGASGLGERRYPTSCVGCLAPPCCAQCGWQFFAQTDKAGHCRRHDTKLCACVHAPSERLSTSGLRPQYEQVW